MTRKELSVQKEKTYLRRVKRYTPYLSNALLPFHSAIICVTTKINNKIVSEMP